MDDKLKPGYKTTEFWLQLLATLISAIMASGLLVDGDPGQKKILQALGLAGVVLSALGYSVPRGGLKKAAQAADVPGLTNEKAEGNG